MFVILNLFMSVAVFEKVSEKQFMNDLKELLDLQEDCYELIRIPRRATRGSAGYDFCCPVDLTVKAHESIRIPTGIRCKMEEGYVLQLYPRSSLGFKYHLCLLNTVGIIDSDYYHADNEGHIIAGLINDGDKDLFLKAGDRFVQGVFLKYETAEEEETAAERHGGFGSTD